MSIFTKTIIVDVDGDGDYQTIKEAADYLGTVDGGTIIVEQGTYVLNGNGNTTTIDVYNNTNIIGRRNVVINVAADITAFKNAGHTAQNPTSNTNIKISGFKIVVDNDLTGVNHVIDLWDVSKSHLKDIMITSNTAEFRNIAGSVFAIRFYTGLEAGCQNNIIEGCRIHDFGYLLPSGLGMGGGIYISKPNSSTYPLKNFIIKNNIISQLSVAGLQIDNAENTIISGNIIFDLQGDGTIGLTTNFQKSVLKGNIFNICGVHGYYPSGANRGAAFGNIFNNNLWTGVHLRYAEVPVTHQIINTENHALTGNVCMGNGLVGIHAQDCTNYSSFFGGQYNENGHLGLRIQNEGVQTPPTDNCVVGNVAHDNEEGVDISVDDYDKQIVANNIGILSNNA